MPFVIGWIIAMIANPLVRFFERRLKIVRKHGTWLVIVGVLALVIGGCYLLFSWLWKEGISFVQNLPGIYSVVVDGFRDFGEKLLLFIDRVKLPAGVKESVADIMENLDLYAADMIGSLGAPTLSAAGDIVSNLPNILVQAVFMFLSAYFFIADKEKISAGIRGILPQSFFERWEWVRKMLSKAVGGYFLAQFKIMGVIAAILFVGFLILDVEYAVLWALLISFLDFLPFLGTGTAIWPWAAFQVMTGNYSMAVGLMIVYLVCLLVHQLLQPKFVGDTVGLDPLATLVFMFIGYRFSSVLGMIVAVPVGIILVSLFKAGAFDRIIGDVRELLSDLNDYRKSE